jgi:acetolactate synthase I/II/III large subunit
LAGERLARVLWTPGPGPGEILIYDSKGVQNYLRIDDLWEPHDLLWHGSNLVAVSPMQNSILWISPSGEIVRRWNASGDGDSCHLNCLLTNEGRLLVSAFGRLSADREWARDMNAATGVVFAPETGETVLDGLSQPHNPRFIDGAWAICNSKSGELLRIDPSTRAVTGRLPLNGYPRGIGITNEFLFVGESAHRLAEARTRSTAQIAIVCRRTWRLLDRLNLPCREVYDLLAAPLFMAEGARRGFRTNPQRTAERDQYAMFDAAGVEPVRLWATGEPLPADACRVRIGAALTRKMRRDSQIEVECTVENLGRAILVSAAPNPVRISYKWFHSGGRRVEAMEGLRTRLSHALVPKDSLSLRLQVRTPPVAGHYALLITLVQEEVAWFDDLCADNAWIEPVEVD